MKSLFLQNGQKHWISGWFDDRAYEVDLSSEGSVYKRLVAFVDYGDESLHHDDLVLIRVGNLYIQYNRAKGYNINSEKPNTVTITKAESDNDVSDSVAALLAGESYSYHNYDEDGNRLIIEVCSLHLDPSGVDYGFVSIYHDDGEQTSSCGSAYTSKPTAAPTIRLLTAEPTAMPISATSKTYDASQYKQSHLG